MRKHEISYHEKTNIIKFTLKFCIHSKEIKTKTTKTSNKEKNISFEKKSFLNQSNHSKFDDSIMNSRKSKKIVIKILFRKKVSFNQSINQSTNNLSRKDKNRQISSRRRRLSIRLKISDSILMNSKSLIRKKRCRR